MVLELLEIDSNAANDWGCRHTDRQMVVAKAEHRLPSRALDRGCATGSRDEMSPPQPSCRKVEVRRSLELPNTAAASGEALENLARASFGGP